MKLFNDALDSPRLNGRMPNNDESLAIDRWTGRDFDERCAGDLYEERGGERKAGRLEL